MPKPILLAIDRLDLSELVLAQWAEVQGISASPSETLRLVETEIRTLQALSDEPERRAELIDRYTSLAACLRLDLH